MPPCVFWPSLCFGGWPACGSDVHDAARRGLHDATLAFQLKQLSALPRAWVHNCLCRGHSPLRCVLCSAVVVDGAGLAVHRDTRDENRGHRGDEGCNTRAGGSEVAGLMSGVRLGSNVVIRCGGRSSVGSVSSIGCIAVVGGLLGLGRVGGLAQAQPGSRRDRSRAQWPRAGPRCRSQCSRHWHWRWKNPLEPTVAQALQRPKPWPRSRRLLSYERSISLFSCDSFSVGRSGWATIAALRFLRCDGASIALPRCKTLWSVNPRVLLYRLDLGRV